MEEQWKHYKDKYSVSNLGRVRNDITNKILKSRVRKNNTNRVNLSPREQINLSFNGKVVTKFIHRLVAETWIPNPNNLPQVNHIDGNSLNNQVSNLEWCTQSENIKHAYQNGLIH